MRPEDIPEPITRLLDERAGRVHSPNGSVMTTLAEILTLWEHLHGRSGDDTTADTPPPPNVRSRIR